MNEYKLARDVFWNLIGGEEVRVGDYGWVRHELFDPDTSGKWVFRRYHVPTGAALFFVCDFYDSDWATMTQVTQVPVLIKEWKRVEGSTGGSHG